MNVLDLIWRKEKQGQFLPIDSFIPEYSVPPGVNEEWRFIARQVIFDSSSRVFGYELLARSGRKNRFTGDSNSATRQMIFEGMLCGFEGLTQGRPAFINCSRESLVEGLVTLLPKSTVLEILETIGPDKQVVAACRHIRSEGHQLALDDFRIVQGIEALVELADYVKVDFRLSDKEERREILSFLTGSKAKLIAEKVETEEESKIASDEGFHLFQGYYFCHPTMYSAKRAPVEAGKKYNRMQSAVIQRKLDFMQLDRACVPLLP